MKLYTIGRRPDGTLNLIAQAEVIDKNAKGRAIGTHIETEVTSDGLDIGSPSDETKALAAAIMRHYYGGQNDPGAAAEADRQTKRFLEGFLLHHSMKPGARLEISSDVLDRFFSL